MKKYPLIENNRFVNYVGEPTHSFFWQSVYMYFLSRIKRLRKNDDEQVRIVQFSQNSVSTETGTDLHVTWIGHASFLIQMGNFSILTDPVFGDLSILFKRIQKPGLALDQLPRIDAVVISHNHRDHLDEFSIREIFKRNPACHFYVPHGDKTWFLKRGITQVTECMWWDKETLRVGETALTIQFLPAYHWSQRGVFDRNKSLWGSWLLQAQSKTVYFAGDTAYDTHFKHIAQEVGAIDLALMPIGPCEPHKWMKHSHMNAEEAGRAFLDLNARIFIPMHWGTYRFGVDSLFGPLDRFNHWWHANQEKLNYAHALTPAWGNKIAVDHTGTMATTQKNSEQLVR